MDVASGDKKKTSWHHPQFSVAIANRHGDGAYRRIQFLLQDFPGVVKVISGLPQLSFRHEFHITLPREYPQNLAGVQIINRTPLFHPRITGIGGKACYAVNGEVDRILVDILFNVLMRPQTVRPPSEFKEADWGLDREKMHWYIQYGPERLYQHLKKQWGKRQQKDKKKITILD